MEQHEAVAQVIEAAGFTHFMGLHIDHLKEVNAVMLAALKDVQAAYQRMFDAMPVAWQTYDHIVSEAIKQAEGAA